MLARTAGLLACIVTIRQSSRAGQEACGPRCTKFSGVIAGGGAPENPTGRGKRRSLAIMGDAPGFPHARDRDAVARRRMLDAPRGSGRRRRETTAAPAPVPPPRAGRRGEASGRRDRGLRPALPHGNPGRALERSRAATTPTASGGSSAPRRRGRRTPRPDATPRTDTGTAGSRSSRRMSARRSNPRGSTSRRSRRSSTSS